MVPVILPHLPLGRAKEGDSATALSLSQPVANGYPPKEPTSSVISSFMLRVGEDDKGLLAKMLISALPLKEGGCLPSSAVLWAPSVWDCLLCQHCQ